MPAILINPTDRQLAKAVQLAHFKQEEDGVDTEASDRVREKRERQITLRPQEVAKMKFIPWPEVAKKLSKLNKTITYTNLPNDGKVGIGFQRPSRKEVLDWEQAVLSPSDREVVRRYGNHQGPRPFLVAASRGWVAPYTTILTDSREHPQIVCRSLKSICAVLIAHGGFTWDEAERIFGFRLLGPGTEVKREKVPHLVPKTWAEERPVCKVD